MTNVEPAGYMPQDEPDVEDQDDALDGYAFLRASAHAEDPLAPNTWDTALQWMQGQNRNPMKSWKNLCLQDVRMSLAIPPLFATAWLAWLGADDDAKHVTENFDDVPDGAVLITKGASAAGHIMLTARKFPSGNSAAWSNDLLRSGLIDKVHRDAPVPVWGHHKVGFMTELNGFDLRVGTKKKPQPKQNKRYKGIERAIHNLEAALETATKQKDQHDIAVLNRNIKRLQSQYENLRRA